MGAKYRPQLLSAYRVCNAAANNHEQDLGNTSATIINKNMRERQKKPSADLEMTEAKWRDLFNQ